MKYQKFNIDFCKKYAITKKGLCLSKVYTTSHQKLLWQCNKGHRWYASFNSIFSVSKKGQLCIV